VKIKNEGALIVPALAAGISVPDDTSNYSASSYVRWTLYRGVQLGRECKEGDEWHNAVIISKLSEYDAQNATWSKLMARGFR
jgi:hypothetical protein